MRTVALLIALVALPAFAEDKQLFEFSKKGDVGHLGRHTVWYRGKIWDNAASVKLIRPDGSAVMVHYYAVSTREDRPFWFLIKGVDTRGWESGDVRELPAKMKVTGWHRVQFKDGVTDVQILEPVREPAQK